MVWHFRFGYTVLSLVLFRIVWGFIGGHWSRWSQLPLHPRAAWAYLNGHAQIEHRAGHNPLGSWSVLALLFFLALQASTGLFSDDEIANAGPLSSWVSSYWVSAATAWHKGWGKTLLILLTLLHLLAIVWYSWRKKQGLVAAMLHGDKRLDDPVPPSLDNRRTRTWAFALWALFGVCVATLVSWAS